MLAFIASAWTIHRPEDRSLFQQIYIDNELLMFKKAMSILHDENEALCAVSDASLRLMRRISTLRELQGPSLQRYVIITTEHAAIDRLRKIKRDNEYVFTAEDERMARIPSGEEPVDEQIIRAGEKQMLAQAISRLPKREQWVLSMRYDEELTYREIAQRIGVKTGSVGVILDRIYKRLRTILEEEGFR
ncbi:MAG: sigma-70 family RNA polymerase sigma factor [Clostridia bacterium]|nr:sigma-70 family RNA polymerase sigma factor [Clostridia bacterium]